MSIAEAAGSDIAGNGADRSASHAGERAPQMPRMPWYPRDFGSATRGWPLVARGAYREPLAGC
jgi:hypothetical protein